MPTRVLADVSGKSPDSLERVVFDYRGVFVTVLLRSVLYWAHELYVWYVCGVGVRMIYVCACVWCV